MKSKNVITNPKTVNLLRKVQKQILLEPRQFDIQHWFTMFPKNVTRVPNCGTAACIAGWAIAFGEAESRNRYKQMARIACKRIDHFINTGE